MAALYLLPDYPLLSIAVLVVLAMAFFYIAREPMRRLLGAAREGATSGLRKLAEGSDAVADRLREQNRKVLVEAGIDQAGQRVVREITRLESTYTKRLAAYPELHLKLAEHVSKIDAEYRECGMVAPEVPGWSEVVDSLLRAKDSTSSRSIKRMLAEIHKTAVASEKKALQEYRSEMAKRHKVLGRMAGAWQRVEKALQRVDGVVSEVLEATGRITKYIESYEELRREGPASADRLSARVTKLFIFSMVVILVATGGAFINFQLIALPMSELVPAGSRIVGMPVAQVAALVIVTLEIVVGIFLLEAIGITNIFPQIAGLERRKRRAVLFAAFAGLFLLAAIESSLAILREHLVEAEIALKQTLAGAPEALSQAEQTLIPVIGQATLGFVLPWILAMVAVPLEMLIESSQHVLTRIVSGLLVAFGAACRGFAYVMGSLLTLLTHLFDALIAVPALVVGAVSRRGQPAEEAPTARRKGSP